jgi:CarD family transcriptional regulator
VIALKASQFLQAHSVSSGRHQFEKRKTRRMVASQAFKIGDMAVYPAHGVGEVTDVQTRSLGGKERSFYILRVVENGMKIMVPVETAAAAGLRPLISKKDAKKVLEILKSDDIAVKTQPWNRRYREYMEMLKSGSPFEVAKVLRDLFRLKSDKDLSFGERRLLDTARSLLVTELALSLGKKEEAVERDIQTLFE